MKQPSPTLTNLSFILVLLIIFYSIIKDFIAGVHWRIPIYIAVLISYSVGFFLIKNWSNWSRLILGYIILSTALGESLFGFFYTTVYYDKVLHFINSILVVFLIYEFLKRRVRDKNKRIFYSLIGTIIIGFVWELIETFMFIFFNVPMVGVILADSNIRTSTKVINFWLGPVMDTIYDFVLNVLGATTGYFLIKKSNSKESR